MSQRPDDQLPPSRIGTQNLKRARKVRSRGGLHSVTSGAAFSPRGGGVVCSLVLAGLVPSARYLSLEGPSRLSSYE